MSDWGTRFCGAEASDFLAPGNPFLLSIAFAFTFTQISCLSGFFFLNQLCLNFWRLGFYSEKRMIYGAKFFAIWSVYLIGFVFLRSMFIDLSFFFSLSYGRANSELWVVQNLNLFLCISLVLRKWVAWFDDRSLNLGDRFRISSQPSFQIWIIMEFLFYSF